MVTGSGFDEVASIQPYLTLTAKGASIGQLATLDAIDQMVKTHYEQFRLDGNVLFSWLASGQLNPVVAYRLPLESVGYAHELLESKAVLGKVVLLPNG